MKSIFKGCCWLISLFEGLELLCTGPTDLLSARNARLLSRCSFATSDSTAFWSWPPYGLLILAFLRPSGLGLPTTFSSWPSYGLLVLAFLRPPGLGLPTTFWSWPSYDLLVLAFLRPSGLGLPTVFWSWPSYDLLVLAFLRPSCLWPSYGLCAFWPLCLLVFVPSGLCAFWPLRLQAFVPSGLCAYFLVLALLRPSGLGLTTTFCCFMGGLQSICIGYAYFPFHDFQCEAIFISLGRVSFSGERICA
jgi:hypothetical protein